MAVIKEQKNVFSDEVPKTQADNFASTYRSAFKTEKRHSEIKAEDEQSDANNTMNIVKNVLRGNIRMPKGSNILIKIKLIDRVDLGLTAGQNVEKRADNKVLGNRSGIKNTGYVESIAVTIEYNKNKHGSQNILQTESKFEHNIFLDNDLVSETRKSCTEYAEHSNSNYVCSLITSYKALPVSCRDSGEDNDRCADISVALRDNNENSREWRNSDRPTDSHENDKRTCNTIRPTMNEEDVPQCSDAMTNACWTSTVVWSLALFAFMLENVYCMFRFNYVVTSNLA